MVILGILLRPPSTSLRICKILYYNFPTLSLLSSSRNTFYIAFYQLFKFL